jgi:ATP-dependent helicase/nuclease subunit B
VTREIWLSPVLGNNRERLLARCAEYLERGQADRLLYITASHPLLDLVTEKLLDGQNARGVWGEFPFYLFRGLVRRILAEATAGYAQRVPIDREELPLRRSLISQIIKQLSAAGKLHAIKPLANRDGCINTIASLIGELQRAGKTAEEFFCAIEEREKESHQVGRDIAGEDARAPGKKSKVESPNSKSQNQTSKAQTPKSQIDFDREVALIYEHYSAALDRYGLTDEDADQLRALHAMRGAIEDQTACLPWIDKTELLVLDGFFDFTPVQGEILKCLIPQIPNVIVNINHDEQNPQIFQPFASTIEHLQSIAPFEIVSSKESSSIAPPLSGLRSRLFNARELADDPQDAEPHAEMRAIQLLECADREIEIRSIAKEVKRLVLTEKYNLSDIALVVRERAAYTDTIVRVFADEGIPCNLERRVEANDIPALRACGKLFQLLRSSHEETANPKATEIAHLIKTGYFRASHDSLEQLAQQFDQQYISLLDDGGKQTGSHDKLRAALGIGRWKPDDLETEAEDPAATAEDEETQDDEAVKIDRRKRPAPVPPAAIAWTILVVRHFQQLLSAMPEECALSDLPRTLMRLLDQLQFPQQVRLPFEAKAESNDIPQATLDVRGRESLRRAIAAAVRGSEYAGKIVSELRPSGRARLDDEPSVRVGLLTQVPLSLFIDEVERCLKSQTLSVGAPDRNGLRVLEASNVRGLSFRAVFIAGMIEGGFPLRTSRDWLYPHEERMRLQKHGIFLEDISTNTLLKEEHYFYQAACRATECLYLTRPLALNDGTETVASYYIEELRRAIAPAAIEVRQIRGDIDGRNPFAASSRGELGTILVRQAETGQRREEQSKMAPSVAGQLLSMAENAGHISPAARQRIDIEHARHGKWFGPYDGEITNDDLRRMLARHFGPDHVYSASRLSTYGNCAFRFFGNRVLRLEPRSEAALDLQAIDAGKLLHDILRRFFEKHRGDYLPARDRKILRDDLTKTADAVFREHEDKVPPLNERIWKIDCEIRKLILDQVLLYEIRLQEKTGGRVLPAFFELAFGRKSEASDPGSTKQFLKLPRGRTDEAALIQGQIDRVDVNEEEGLALAYDYKLSKGATLDDIRTGRQTQIPIYLAALEQLFLPSFELGGGGYYTLRGKGARLNQGLYRTALADCTNVTSPRAKLDDLEWQHIRQDVATRVWQFIDGMRSGQFRLKPSLGRHTCKFCDYSAVCRYDAYRINRKETI